MTEQIMKHQSKRARKSIKVVNFARQVVAIDEELPSQAILKRLNTADYINNKSGRVPQCYIPQSTTSLGMVLKASRFFQMIPNGESKSHNAWRRIE